MSEGIQIHISEKPVAEGDKGPQIIIGYSNSQFSQAVFLDAPTDPKDAVRFADALYQSILTACGNATKAWNERENNDSAS